MSKDLKAKLWFGLIAISLILGLGGLYFSGFQERLTSHPHELSEKLFVTGGGHENLEDKFLE
jgi:hypothetical protein